MIHRQIVLPVTPAELWHTLTDPDEASAWFGGRVEWDLVPGGSLEVLPTATEDPVRKSGYIDEVDPDHSLRFVWWPSDMPEQRSEVTYDIEPHDDGSMLEISERMVPFFVEASARILLSAPREARTAATTLVTSPMTFSSWDMSLLLLEASVRRTTLVQGQRGSTTS